MNRKQLAYNLKYLATKFILEDNEVDENEKMKSIATSPEDFLNSNQKARAEKAWSELVTFAKTLEK